MGKLDSLNPLKKWVLTNKYFIKISDTKEKKAQATHFLLDGGIWKIPLFEYQTFLKLLATDLHAGEKHYISENKTPIFKFICDLDFYEESVITNISSIVTVIQNIVNEYFGEQRIIICGADSKKVTINETEYVKSGFHLVFPKLWVTVETSKKLRILFIEKLIETFSERKTYNKWEDVVDLSVYEDNGLRMVGCRKIGICKLCKNKKGIKETCEMCEGVGKKDENRIYTPICVLPNDNTYLHSIKNDYYVMLLETSIYNYNDHQATQFIKQLNVVLVEKSKKNKTNVNVNELDSKIQKFIRTNYKEKYSKCCVKKVTKTDSTYYVEIDDNFCMNVNRNHTSSNIYFQIQPSGICQRCYCKKESIHGRLHGMCKEYASKQIPLNNSIKKLLFGNEIVSKKNKSIVTYNITQSYDKQSYLNNSKNILWQLKNELL